MKKQKTIVRILLMLIVIVGTMILPNTIKASSSVSRYFGITDLRRDTNMGYAIGNPDYNTEKPTAAKIWDIIEYANGSGGNIINADTTNVYCARAGVGFTRETGGTSAIQEYDIAFNMYTEKSEIAKKDESTDSKILYNLANSEYYDDLLALANLLYLRGDSTEAEKENLLEKAGILDIQKEYEGIEGYEEHYKMTEDEIEAIQQAAIWYFTNHDEAEIYGKYPANEYDAWIYYITETDLKYDTLTGYNPTNGIVSNSAGNARQRQATALYNYLIKTAMDNASHYAGDKIEAKYMRNKVTLYASNTQTDAQPLMEIEKIDKEFDLALRKYITGIKTNEETTKIENRVPAIVYDNLNDDSETTTTAEYKHRKDPVVVEEGTVVTYNITIYNEGDIAGRATKIVDQLPTGLEYTNIVTEGYKADYDKETNKVTITGNAEYLNPYEENTLDSETIQIECTVTSKTAEEILTNVAWIAEAEDEYGNIVDNGVKDIDSSPNKSPEVNKDSMKDYKGNTENKTDLTDTDYFYKGQEDDDDFEKLIVTIPEEKEFDLKLIKRITAVNDKAVPERLLGVDITNLANGSATTADYKMNKEPVLVSTGNLVTYTFRIYNEGDIDGYAQEITEDIPEGLEFLGADVDKDMNPITDKDELEAVEFNTSMGWTYVDGDSTKISTDYLAKGKGEEITKEGANLIKAFDSKKPYSDTETNKNPDYREISVIFKVVAKDSNIGIMRNEAAITEDADGNGDPIDDRDSSTENWVKYEDDEDYDNVIIQEFDLALRKFITKVDEEVVTTRVPEVSYDREEDKITYNHTKDPVEVVTGNVVEYTIRVYNEGDIAGYANEIADDIPDGLRYLPENETNIKYRWVMYNEEGKETENVEEAIEIRTDYLSKEQEKTEGENLLEAFNEEEEIGEGNPDYKDVKVAFEVIEPNGSDKIIINSAQITDDSDKEGKPIEDIDSIPGEWNEGEDDQDKEYIKLTYFDLSLRKWVTEAIVIEDGKETITQTGHTAEMDPEPVVKVELYRKNINDVVVKFRYKIRVTNEGDIPGYAKEITDYVPEGLKFLPEDNPEWKDEGNNVISTRALEDVLLKPGESAEVEVVLTWINGEDNMGVMTNTAEISKDDNDKDVPDRDSTPDNKKPGEDDIDDAPVIVSIETGQERIYFVLGFTVLGTLAGGLALIKKFVL